MFLIRYLIFVLLTLVSSVAWSQQPAGWPPVLFWPFNPYLLQPQYWPQLAPSVPGQVVPFPTPFWLWPVQQPQPATKAAVEAPVASQLPAASTPAAPAATASAASVPAPAPAPISQANPEPAETLTPAVTPAVPTLLVTPIEIPPATTPEPTGQTEPATLPALMPPAETSAPGAAVSDPAKKPKLIKKSRTAKPKTTQKVRKLCWKDGRLDVCP
jgi:hypothetical protein